MCTCPFCHASLEAVPDGGRCTSCGGRLPPADAQVGKRQLVGTTSTVSGCLRSDDITGTIVATAIGLEDPEIGYRETDEEAATVCLDDETIGKAAGRVRSDDFMRTLWAGAIGPTATPGASLRARDGALTAESTLSIRSCALHRTAEVPQDGSTDYELLEQVGEGGMGVVYAARQASMDRVVAVKMLRGDIAADHSQRDKFLSEAVVTAELDHPNIVPIHDLGTNESGALFYSMKHIQGIPWSEVIGQKSLEENLEILLKVCDAIAFAHTRGMMNS